MPVIRHVCAVCKKVLGYTNSFGAPGGDSHGLCAEHYAEELKKVEAMTKPATTEAKE